MEIIAKKFQELTVDELYEIIKLRINIFVVEQNCPYPDLDDKDQDAYHVYIRDEEGIQAYLRVLKAGVRFPEVVLGRVITKTHGKGFGLPLMKAGIDVAVREYHADKIRIAAQKYAIGFYEKAGFHQCSGDFLEDGIVHVEMLWEKEKRPVDYAMASIETMMRKFTAQDLPPKGHFHYHQGVFLSGVYETYQLCKKEVYFQYMKDWVDSIINEKGEIHTFDPGQLDDIQPGILLFPLLKRTGDTRYKKALDTLLPYVKNFPTNAEGGFWHKQWCPNQMWLDGLYMAGPIAVEYGSTFNHPEYIAQAVFQAQMMEQKTRDEKTGLWYHAWDASKEAEWSDPVTGRSPEFWGRSMGWVPVALLNEMDFLNVDSEEYKVLARITTDLLKALCHWQSEDGRWYQVVNKPEEKGNWLENSCSCLYVAGLCKAVGKGLLDDAYLSYARKGYEGVIRSLEYDGEDLLIGNVCVGTGVCNYEQYCARPTSTNDLHGVGAFLLMCAEAEKQIGKK